MNWKQQFQVDVSTGSDSTHVQTQTKFVSMFAKKLRDKVGVTQHDQTFHRTIDADTTSSPELPVNTTDSGETVTTYYGCFNNDQLPATTVVNNNKPSGFWDQTMAQHVHKKCQMGPIVIGAMSGPLEAASSTQKKVYRTCRSSGARARNSLQKKTDQKKKTEGARSRCPPWPSG